MMQTSPYSPENSSDGASGDCGRLMKYVGLMFLLLCLFAAKHC